MSNLISYISLPTRNSENSIGPALAWSYGTEKRIKNKGNIYEDGTLNSYGKEHNTKQRMSLSSTDHIIVDHRMIFWSFLIRPIVRSQLLIKRASNGLLPDPNSNLMFLTVRKPTLMALVDLWIVRLQGSQICGIEGSNRDYEGTMTTRYYIRVRIMPKKLYYP